MGNSMMNYNQKTLWMHDFFLEPIIYFVWKDIDGKIKKNQIPKEHLNWFIDYNQELANLFIGASDGALDLEFDDLKKDDFRFNLVRDILTSLHSVLNEEDIELGLDDFDEIGGFSFGNYSLWDEKMSTKTLAKKVLEIIEWVK